MPWTPKDAKSHTHKAASATKQRQWAHVANSVLEKTGNEGLAVREANGVVGHSGLKGERTDNYRHDRTHRGRFGG